MASAMIMITIRAATRTTTTPSAMPSCHCVESPSACPRGPVATCRRRAIPVHPHLLVDARPRLPAPRRVGHPAPHRARSDASGLRRPPAMDVPFGWREFLQLEPIGLGLMSSTAAGEGAARSRAAGTTPCDGTSACAGRRARARLVEQDSEDLLVDVERVRHLAAGQELGLGGRRAGARCLRARCGEERSTAVRRAFGLYFQLAECRRGVAPGAEPAPLGSRGAGLAQSLAEAFGGSPARGVERRRKPARARGAARARDHRAPTEAARLTAPQAQLERAGSRGAG